MAEWWQGAVFYQIYPRSFQDSDGDGVGDLPGILSRLSYIADLGVDAIWLSPFFTSPMADFGYDVADYCSVDPLFGNLDDFDRLLAKAHDLGLKVIIDQVYSHTSDQHQWFRESRTNKTNDKADWYVWEDPRPDGGPPTNWHSVFGGPAWTWDTRRRQYYLHNFLSSQPDLNFHNLAVQDAILDVARFWLDRGVDGFRLDVANYYFHDADLRDNPPSGLSDQSRPYLYQQHLYNRSRPESLTFTERLRALTDNYDDRMMVGELFTSAPVDRTLAYTEGKRRLHTAYNFFFLEQDHVSQQLLQQALTPFEKQNAWPSWSFSNHDVPRAVSRLTNGHPPGDGLAKLLLALVAGLRGTIFLYQGEELGLPQADIAFEDLQDPEAIRFWPDNLGRDGCRTPIPWEAAAHQAGFSTVKPWLPIAAPHRPQAVDKQMSDPRSVLRFTQTLLAARKSLEALQKGTLTFHEAPDPMILFERQQGASHVLCAYNPSPTPLATPIPLPNQSRQSELVVSERARLDGDQLTLGPYGFAWVSLRVRA